MTAPVVTVTADLEVFLRAVGQFPAGAEITVEHIRDELEAAQIHSSQYGPLFGRACDLGVLASTNRAVKCRKPSRKGGWAGIYKVVAP